MDEIKSYFESQWQANNQAKDQKASAVDPGCSGHDASQEGDDDHVTITWDQGDWQAAEGLRARCHAAAMLANAAADVSAPLVTASDLRVRHSLHITNIPQIVACFVPSCIRAPLHNLFFYNMTLSLPPGMCIELPFQLLKCFSVIYTAQRCCINACTAMAVDCYRKTRKVSAWQQTRQYQGL